MVKLTDVGERRHRVTIERPGVATRDSWGETVPGAAAERIVWARVTPAPGTERFANAENAATAPVRFVLRWVRDLVRVTDTLVHEGRPYDVKSVTDVGFRDGIEVLAVARGEALSEVE